MKFRSLLLIWAFLWIEQKNTCNPKNHDMKSNLHNKITHCFVCCSSSCLDIRESTLYFRSNIIKASVHLPYRRGSVYIVFG